MVSAWILALREMQLFGASVGDFARFRRPSQILRPVQFALLIRSSSVPEPSAALKIGGYSTGGKGEAG